MSHSKIIFDLSAPVRQPLVRILPQLRLLELLARILCPLVNLHVKISLAPTASKHTTGAYRVPQLESQIQVSGEALAMLEPVFAL